MSSNIPGFNPVLWIFHGTICEIVFSESGKSRRLRGDVGYVGCVGVWVKFLRGLRGSNIFLRGPNFFAWVFAWVKIFNVSPKFLRWSTFIY